jgi:hypothetical protein
LGQIDEQKAQSLVEDKQQMAEALSELQKDLRNSVHEHRLSDAGAKQRLTEIVNDVESSDLMYRVRRSAAEIYYGRARDAAAREGIITESMQALERNLREAAEQAGQEGQKSPGEQMTAERLLAEVAELRRRVEQRERLQARGQSQQDNSTPGEGNPSNSEQSNESAQQGDRQGSASANTGNRGLSAWDPSLANARLPNATNQNRDSFARQAEGISDRANRLLDRASNRELSASELTSLRNMARELRKLAGDPLASESASMKEAVAQVELAALAAMTNSMRSEAARTTVPVGESEEYREAVAEYYRRLGGS